MEANDIDMPSYEVILQLQLEELDEMELTLRNDQTANACLGDLETEGVVNTRPARLEAIRIQREELESELAVIANGADRQQIGSLNSAERSGEEVAVEDENGEQLDMDGVKTQNSDIERVQAQEKSDHSDDNQGDSNISDDGSSEHANDLMSGLARILEQEGHNDGESVHRRMCIACEEQIDINNIVRCPCSHEYCKECLRQLFDISFKTERHFPAQCCGQPIPLNLQVRNILGAEGVQTYEEKAEEFSTIRRVYCYRKTCSAFIPPRNFALSHNFLEKATCSRCHSDTCVQCGQESHPGIGCPIDPARQQILDIAHEQGWAQCYRCKELVELNMGCFHMTCRCGAEFCYVCARKWKSCDCPQWNEHNLLARAEEIFNRGFGAIQLPPFHQRAHIERERVNLIVNHECRRHSWHSRRGDYNCEICHAHMSRFINECRFCRRLACNRCRRTRRNA